jgi:hypothetical protein
MSEVEALASVVHTLALQQNKAEQTNKSMPWLDAMPQARETLCSPVTFEYADVPRLSPATIQTEPLRHDHHTKLQARGLSSNSTPAKATLADEDDRRRVLAVCF